MPTLGVVVASVREGRAGLPIANWFLDRARQHGKFEANLVDLKQVNLPIFAEKNHPRLGQYEGEAQQAWARTVAGIDAFAFVTPEYNFSVSPALLNAFDYLYAEWHYKPAAFVSYGGISGGLRAVQMTKLTLTALKMMPIPEAVTIPFVAQAVDRAAGTFKATDVHEKAATTLLDELHRWTGALAPLRQPAK